MSKDTIYFGNALKNPKYSQSKEDLKFETSDDDGKWGQTFAGLDSSLESAAHADQLNRFHARQGHGFAAEQANDGIDTLFGKDAKILGNDNAKNGPDRIVDGQYIQTKYCQNAQTSVDAAFKDGGQGAYRYRDLHGNPMQLEVPSDQYEEAVRCMERKIAEGKVPGVTDPQKARDLVRKGHVTYEQAKAIAKAGTIESLTFDAAHGIVIGASALGISATITFAQALWNGESVQTALDQALIAGFKAGGAGFLIAVGTAQLARTGVNQVLMTPSITVVKVLPPPVRHALVNFFRNGAPIYGGAATNNLAKLMRSNAIASTVAIVVLSSGNIINFFRGRMSAGQLMAEVGVLSSGILGGGIAMAIGGVLFAPLGGIALLLGTAASGIIGGTLSSSAVQELISKFHESDAQKMSKILEESFRELAEAHLLNQEEGLLALEELRKLIGAEELLCMFASDDRKLFADTVVKTAIDSVIKHRAKIFVPKNFGEPEKTVYDHAEEDDITKRLRALDFESGKGESLSNKERSGLYTRLKALYAKRQSYINGAAGVSCLMQMKKDEVLYAEREKLINDQLQRLEEELGTH